MRSPAALGAAAVIEGLVVTALALYQYEIIPASTFGGVRSYSVAYALHLPASLLVNPAFQIAAFFRMTGPSVLLMTALVVVTAQVGFLAAAIRGLVNSAKLRATALAVVGIVLVAIQLRPLPYPPGMDENRDRVISLDEWVRFHAGNPKFYGGYDASGYISRDGPGYFEREFKRVDCNNDLAMDTYEYDQLRWNMRWCTSDLRPMRPWWR